MRFLSRTTFPMRSHNRTLRLIALWTLGLGLMACAASPNPPSTVPTLDVERYAGTWFEIASFPIRPQRGCVGTTATYTPRTDGSIDVLNQCYDGAFDARLRGATARAFVPDASTPGQLRVQFFWPFRADYWIVDLDPAYTTAVVSNARRSTLWILHRDPCMPAEILTPLLQALDARGFDLERLRTTPQRAADGTPCRATLP